MFKIRPSRSPAGFFFRLCAVAQILPAFLLYNLLLWYSTTFTCKCGLLTIFHLCGIIVDFGSLLC